jgi:hypothetical protein
MNAPTADPITFLSSDETPESKYFRAWRLEHMAAFLNPEKYPDYWRNISDKESRRRSPVEPKVGGPAKSKRTGRITKEEAEQKVVAWFKKHAREIKVNPRFATVRRIHRDTGVSIGAISDLPVWQAFLVERKVSVSRAVRATRLNDHTMAVVGVEDTELAKVVPGRSAAYR